MAYSLCKLLTGETLLLVNYLIKFLKAKFLKNPLVISIQSPKSIIFY